MREKLDAIYFKDSSYVSEIEFCDITGFLDVRTIEFLYPFRVNYFVLQFLLS